MNGIVRPLLVFIAAFIPALASASWLSEITGIDIDLNSGSAQVKPPNPAAIPQMIQNLPKDVGQVLLNPAAPVLATAIRNSRGQALNRGTQPVPANIQIALASYFPRGILQKVRWTTAGGVSIDGALKNWFNQEGAVTLDDVIVFSSAGQAQDLALWAHELTHVLQYAQMGVESFAFTYMYQWNDLEQQARQNAGQIMSSINATNRGQSATWGIAGNPGGVNGQLGWNVFHQAGQQYFPPPPPGFPSGYGMLMCGCHGPVVTPFVSEPRCQTGAVRVNACPGMCPAGGQPYAYVCR